jgi:hypothetical protein
LSLFGHFDLNSLENAVQARSYLSESVEGCYIHKVVNFRRSPITTGSDLPVLDLSEEAVIYPPRQAA